jgi:hypothetical protein
MSLILATQEAQKFQVRMGNLARLLNVLKTFKEK